MRDYQFGEFIYELRRERNLSQSKLGELVGVSNKAVSKWENGVSKPSMDTLKKLSELFCVSMEELLAARRFSEESGGHPPEPDCAYPVAPMPEGAAAVQAGPSVATACKKKPRFIFLLVLCAVLSLVLCVGTVYHGVGFGMWLFSAKGPFGSQGLTDVKSSVVKVETDIGTGSGFCAIEENWIITNYHVIENAYEIYIIDDAGTKTEITDIIFYDKEKDIAVLEMASPMVPIPLGDGSALGLQDDITVIGSPQGMLNTVSVGIIGNLSYEEYLVVSAPISPGSSGGVLLNDRFEAIGIITATATDEFAQNLNFAINIEKLKAACAVYRAGEYPAADYPLTSDGTAPPYVSGQDPHAKEEIPLYFLQSKPQYIASEKLFRIYFSMGSSYGHQLAANVELGFVITNTWGTVVYEANRVVRKSEFSPDSITRIPTATIDLPVSAITPGEIATGKIMIKLIYRGREVDRETWDIDCGLPIKETPFETLYYAGTGTDTITDIDLPYGTYNIIVTYEGTNEFKVQLNGRDIYTELWGGPYYYVHQVRPAEDSWNEGTPLKNAIIDIINADAPWTVTVERAAVSGEFTYVDDMTYSGSGVGYVKNIYLPKGSYNLVITHYGTGYLDVQLFGHRIVRRHGRFSYVHTIHPAGGSNDIAGTPLTNAYFNIVEAGGDWSITIHRVD